MPKLLTLAAVCLLAVTAGAADLTVDQILAKNVEARGGAEKLRALQSVRFSGKISIGPMEMPFTMIKKRPEMMKIEFTLQGMTGIQAYDGTSGWMVMPFMGRKDPQTMAGDELTMAKEQADFDGPLFDYAKKGHKAELLGTADVGGKPAYQVQLTTGDAIETIAYFDATSFLQVKHESKRKVQGQEITAETLLGNYQEAGGIRFPFSIVLQQNGSPAVQTITFEKAEINLTLDDAVFAKPAAGPSTPARP